MPKKEAPKGPAARLLDTATALFAREGIRAVGVDRILSESGTARASLYQAYGSKDGLVVAYLEALDATDRAAFERSAARCADPLERVLLPFDLAAKAAARRDFRGCRYLNALTEFSDPRHPVFEAVRRHREWVAGQWTRALGEAGREEPGPLVARLAVLYDGGLAASKAARTSEPILAARAMAAELLAAVGVA